MENQVAEEPEKEKTLVDIIQDLPNAPDQITIDSWKTKYKNIFFSGFSEEECFIFRALNRTEFRELQIASQLAATKEDPKTPAELELRIRESVIGTFNQEDEVVTKCVLWPQLTVDELGSKAGTVTTLFEQIMANSHFLSPQQAQLLVVKL